LEPEFGPREVDDETLAALTRHRWPGNVRELRHAVHRAVALSSHRLRLEDLLPAAPRRWTPPVAVAPAPAGAAVPGRAVRAAVPAASPAGVPAAVPEAVIDPPAGPIDLVDAAMRRVLLEAYRRHGSLRRAARALHMPKSTYADRLRRFKIALD